MSCNFGYRIANLNSRDGGAQNQRFYALWCVCNRSISKGLKATLIAWLSFAFLTPVFAKPTDESAFYAGGVAGVSDLLVPANSRRFRSNGGGLYIHHSGWMSLKPTERQQILQIFQGAPVFLELGWRGGGTAWGKSYEQNYLGNVAPTYVCCDAFDNDKHELTLEQWHDYSMGLRNHGVPQSSRILPIFGFPNYYGQDAVLSDNRVSFSKSFQSVIEEAGGIILDTPPRVAMKFRNNVYRTWIVDAIKWTNGKGLWTVVIISPGALKFGFNSGTHWNEDIEEYVHYLYSQHAMPSFFVVENYSANTPPGYVNRVGADNAPNTVLGESMLLQQRILPGLKN